MNLLNDNNLLESLVKKVFPLHVSTAYTLLPTLGSDSGESSVDSSPFIIAVVCSTVIIAALFSVLMFIFYRRKQQKLKKYNHNNE